MSVNWKQRDRFIKETSMEETKGKAVSPEASPRQWAVEDAYIIHTSISLIRLPIHQNQNSSYCLPETTYICPVLVNSSIHNKFSPFPNAIRDFTREFQNSVQLHKVFSNSLNRH